MSTAVAQPTFTKIGERQYRVRLTGTDLGKVWFNSWSGTWASEHSDGTPGPGAWTRIDAAWALVNS